MNRTIYIPDKLTKDVLFDIHRTPCAMGAYFANNVPRCAIIRLPQWPAEKGYEVLNNYWRPAVIALRRLIGSDNSTALIPDANNSIPDPHDRALVAQWLFSGIPDPADAHIERMADRRMYFEVIMLEPEQHIPTVREPVEAKVTVGDLVVA